MENKLLEIFKIKLDDVLRVADADALTKARAAWDNIVPAPSCAPVKNVMQNIKHALASGHVAREQAAMQFVSEITDSYGQIISPEVVNSLLEIVEKAFPRDYYVRFAQQTKAVYERRAPYEKHKFDENTFKLELTCIQASSSHMANQTISKVRLFFDEFILKESIMDALTKKKADRFRFLNLLYEKTNGNTVSIIPTTEIGRELGMARDEIDSIIVYLQGEYLVKRSAMRMVSITHEGVVEIERSLSKPKEATEYFPAVQNIINIHHMVGSQIQQGTHGSTQNQQVSQNDIEAIQILVKTLLEKFTDIPFNSNEDKAEAEAEIRTVEAQLKSSKPKLSILRESLSTLRSIIEGVTSSTIATSLLPLFTQIAASLGF